jgi:hypothetical protein
MNQRYSTTKQNGCLLILCDKIFLRHHCNPCRISIFNVMRQHCHTASVVRPCILWIDEVEKAFGGVGQDSGVNDRVFGSFLNWLEDRAAPVFVVATANDITRLPVEFMRKGRFDDTFFVDIPKPHERQEIFKVHIHQVQRNPDGFDLQARGGSKQWIFRRGNSGIRALRAVSGL